MNQLLESIANLPNEFERFWNAGIGMQVQILFFFGVLYFFGYYTARLLKNRNLLKWVALIIGFPTLVYPFLVSGKIAFIAPIVIGFLRGFWGDYSGYRLSDWMTDFRYRFRSSRMKSPPPQKETQNNQARETMERARHYEAQAQASYERQKQAERDSKAKRHEDELRWQRGRRAKPDRDASESSPQREKPKEKVLDPSVLLDAYEILGVSNGATIEECKKARMTLLSMYHPDKVAHLNESRRKFAEEEAKRINASWERINR